MSKKSDSMFRELIQAIQYCFDSKKGRYSLETYLEIVGEYTDRTIISAEKEGMRYLGGECEVKLGKNEIIDFEVEMFFENRKGQSQRKVANRELPFDKFTRETISTLEAGMLKFNIEKPEE